MPYLVKSIVPSHKPLFFTQPGLERVISFHIEHRNELGDLKEYRLVLELMGKHSNLILVNDENKIIDSIKRISFNVSSVREVLPGRDYFIPQTQFEAGSAPYECGGIL